MQDRRLWLKSICAFGVGISLGTLGVHIASKNANEPESMPLPGPFTFNSSVLPENNSSKLIQLLHAELTKSDWHDVTVKKGDSLASIFQQLSIPAKTLMAMKSVKNYRDLKTIRPGQVFQFVLDSHGQLEKLRTEMTPLKELSIERNSVGGYQSQIIKLPSKKVMRYSTMTIRDSLFYDGNKAGIDDDIIFQLMNIYAWDIDFAKDIRRGDRFNILYETYYRNGEMVMTGSILAAEFIHKGKPLYAIRFKGKDGSVGFYTESGRSLQRAFLRNPVKFSRISSRFNLKRRHPVLNRIRAHKGVDYAAPIGTPIRATGDGKISFIGWNRGYGRVIKIQHGKKIMTVYAHMHRYARRLKKGSRVKQGQIIGYVGKSGLATGAHLHYEFQVNSRHRDPLKVKLPQARAVPKASRQAFAAQAKQMISLLDQNAHIQVAKNTQ